MKKAKRGAAAELPERLRFALTITPDKVTELVRPIRAKNATTEKIRNHAAIPPHSFCRRTQNLGANSGGQLFRYGSADIVYFSLALFPFFLVLAVLVGWLPSTSIWKPFATWTVTYLPAESRSLVFSIIVSLSNGSTGILSFGLLSAVWSASLGFVSLMESLSVTYGSP